MHSILRNGQLPLTDANRAHWMLGPFSKEDEANPVLQPDTSALFDCMTMFSTRLP